MLYAFIEVNCTHNDFKLDNMVINDSSLTQKNDVDATIYIIDFGETSIRFICNGKVYYLCKRNIYYKHIKLMRKPVNGQYINPLMTINAYEWYTHFFVNKRKIADYDIYYFLSKLQSSCSSNITPIINELLNKFNIMILKKSVRLEIYHPTHFFHDIMTINDIDCSNLLFYRLYELAQILSTHNDTFKKFLATQKISNDTTAYNFLQNNIDTQSKILTSPNLDIGEYYREEYLKFGKQKQDEKYTDTHTNTYTHTNTNTLAETVLGGGVRSKNTYNKLQIKHTKKRKQLYTKQKVMKSNRYTKNYYAKQHMYTKHKISLTHTHK